MTISLESINVMTNTQNFWALWGGIPTKGKNTPSPCKGFLTGAEAENKRAGDNRGTDVEERWRK